MNYLAHAYLSFHRPQVLVGNMISDFVKGKQKNAYPNGIYAGIMLHRAIDNFTDLHKVTKEAKAFFREDYGLYAGAFMDIVYDHFLALDSDSFATYSLADFSQETYRVLEQYDNYFPTRFRLLFPYMKQQNWLYNYQFEEGIRNSFRGLVHRAMYMNDSAPAFDIFLKNYVRLGDLSALFLPEVKRFAREYLDEVLPGQD